MLWVCAIVVPPLAVLLCGKPVQALVNVLLWVLGLVPGIVHALLVVSSHQADKRTERLVRAVREGQGR